MSGVSREKNMLDFSTAPGVSVLPQVKNEQQTRTILGGYVEGGP